MSFKKVGISMVALVITIIVLIILTAAVVITGVNAPKQAQLAVFYSNIDTVQDLVSLTMGNNMIEGAINGCDDNCKWVNIVAGYSFNNGTLQKPASAFTGTLDGIGENIEPIMSTLLNNTTLADGEKSKYYVGKSGKVYYEGFEYEGNTYYNKDTMIVGTNKQIEIVVPVVITKDDIAEHPTDYYGAVVNYMDGEQPFRNLDNNADLEWRIFYTDGNNIYITTTGIIGSKNFTNIDVAMKYLKCEVDGTIPNTSEYINSYADSSKTTNGIPYPIFKDSYNAIAGANAQNLSVNANGAVNNVYNTVSVLSGLQANLYNIGTWYRLASPSANSSNIMMSVLHSIVRINSQLIFNGVAPFPEGTACNVRPLVCLKSDVQLVKNGDAYDIRITQP